MDPSASQANRYARQADEQTFLKTWLAGAAFVKRQPGFIATQLHRAIGEAPTYLNYAVWESTAAFRQAEWSDCRSSKGKKEMGSDDRTASSARHNESACKQTRARVLAHCPKFSADILALPFDEFRPLVHPQGHGDGDRQPDQEFRRVRTKKLKLLSFERR